MNANTKQFYSVVVVVSMSNKFIFGIAWHYQEVFILNIMKMHHGIFKLGVS